MSQHHLVRVGALGHVGRFRSLDATCYLRGTEVVVRTARGLEIGSVLAPPERDRASADEDGVILRGMTAEDCLLQARLEKNRHEAYEACVELLAQHGSAATLLEVEQLFDGKTLFFYFLGQVEPALETLTQELAETYDAKVQLAKFAETLSAGCGPGCGTDDAENGCASGACVSCAVATACGTRKNKN